MSSELIPELQNTAQKYTDQVYTHNALGCFGFSLWQSFFVKFQSFRVPSVELHLHKEVLRCAVHSAAMSGRGARFCVFGTIA